LIAGCACWGILDRREQARQQAQAQTQTQQAQQVSASQMDAFKKAFSACMEGKQYIAKF
jgi:hypothetical protein